MIENCPGSSDWGAEGKMCKACTLEFCMSIALFFSFSSPLALKCVWTGAVISLTAQNVTFHGRTAQRWHKPSLTLTHSPTSLFSYLLTLLVIQCPAETNAAGYLLDIGNLKKKQLQQGNKLLRLNVHTGSRRSLMIYLEPECSGISDEKSIFWLEDDISKAFLLADLSAAVMWPRFRKQRGGSLSVCLIWFERILMLQICCVEGKLKWRKLWRAERLLNTKEPICSH